MKAVKLQKQSILVTEIMNLGADPEDIYGALEIQREYTIGHLANNRSRDDVIAITDIIKNISLVMNEIGVAIGKGEDDN